MKNIKRAIVIGGLTAAGLVMAGYRVYELNRIRKEIKEEQIIEVEIEDTK